MRKQTLYTILYCILVMGLSKASYVQHDSIRISLLTCSPGEEIYALYGHTALRYQNITRGDDWVFNYGVFDFNKPHFMWRFTKGETDYELGAIPYSIFSNEYRQRGSSVTQQQLNLTSEEAERLITLLSENYRPQNRVYRYNYFYDNCTTRARDVFENAIDGVVVYNDMPHNYSYRNILHTFSTNSPWAEFGIDLALGASADKPITARQQMFAPSFMQHFASDATITNSDNTQRPLISKETTLIPAHENRGETSRYPSPLAAGTTLLAITILITLWERKANRIFWSYDILLFTAQGAAGIVITFLFFFSTHPTVDTNWLIIFFNPLPLICLS